MPAQLDRSDRRLRHAVRLTVSNPGSWLGAFSGLLALMTAGCFQSPTVNPTTMICQQELDCPSGYVCKAKGIPGGCCRPNDNACGLPLDSSTPDLLRAFDATSMGDTLAASVDLFSELPQSFDFGADHGQTTADSPQADAVLADALTLDVPQDLPRTSDPAPDVFQDLPSVPDRVPDASQDPPPAPDIVGDASQDPPAKPDTARDTPQDPPSTPDINGADVGCTVSSPGVCCSPADCILGGVGTVAACSAGLCSYDCDSTHRTCEGACIPKGSCCTDADCSGSTPECKAGTCVGGVLSVTPTTQSFGSVVVGEQSAAITFVVSNTGTGSAGSLTTVVAGSAEFAISSNGCAGTSLGPGLSCVLSVNFGPRSAGAKTASLQISGNPGGSIASSLQGTGILPAALAIEPPSYVFPTTTTGGSTSAATTFTVRNTGSVAAGTTVGLATSLTGADPNEFAISTNTCAASLGPNVSCLVMVAFKPSLLSSGSKAATLLVTATPGGSTTANLAGTAQECDSSAQCTVPNRPICINNACRGCASGSSTGHCGGSSTPCDPCAAKNANAQFCDGDAASPMYDRCVACIAQITCNDTKAYCSPSSRTCLACTQAPNPDSACDNATGATYNHCVLTGSWAGTCIHAQCTKNSDCDPEIYPGLPYCNDCTCAATPGTVVCP
jgi:hypothetical protein